MGLRELGVVVPLERYWQYWSAKLIPAVLEGGRQVATQVGIPLKTRPQSTATLESYCARANVRRIGNTGSWPQSQTSKLHRKGSLLPRQDVGMEASQLSERGLNTTVKCKEAIATKPCWCCAGHVGHAASTTREAQQVIPNLRIFQLANTANYGDLFGSPLLAISRTKGICTGGRAQDLIVAMGFDSAAKGDEGSVVNGGLRNCRGNNGTGEPQPELRQDALPMAQATKDLCRGPSKQAIVSKTWGNVKPGGRRQHRQLNAAALQRRDNTQRFQQKLLDNCMAGHHERTSLLPSCNGLDDLVVEEHLGGHVRGVDVFQPATQTRNDLTHASQKTVAVDRIVGISLVVGQADAVSVLAVALRPLSM